MLDMNMIKCRWARDVNPIRQFVLWGWYENEPSFLVFLGPHEMSESRAFISENDIEQYKTKFPGEKDKEISDGKYYILNEEISFIGYTIIKGQNNHLARIPDLKLLYVDDINYRQHRRRYYGYDAYSRPRNRILSADEFYLVNKKGLSRNIKDWKNIASYKDKRIDFIRLEESQRLTINYFKNSHYDQAVSYIKEKKIDLQNFKVAENPNDIIGLDKTEYLEDLITILSDPSLYKRKKALENLIQKKPPKEIYLKIIELGTVDAISGLFLELGRKKDGSMQNIAEKLKNGTDTAWITNRKQEYGLQRCIDIYLRSLSKKAVEIRLKQIRNIIKTNPIKIIGVSDKKYKKKIDIAQSTNWRAETWDKFGPVLVFEPNFFTDGNKLNHIALKNLIQEIDIYNDAEITGLLAHLLDTPTLFHLASKNDNQGFHVYLRRYIRRLMDRYIQNDPESYFIVVKSFLKSYKPEDTVYSSNSPVHVYNQILLDDIPKTLKYEERSVSNITSYYSYSSSSYPKTDYRLIREELKSKQKTKIFEKFASDFIEILVDSSVQQIQEFCFQFLRKQGLLENIEEKLSPSQLVKLSFAANYSVSNFFVPYLENLLKDEKNFTPELLMALLDEKNSKFQVTALKYIEDNRQKFSEEFAIDFLFLHNLVEWHSLFTIFLRTSKIENLEKFICKLLAKIPEFIDHDIMISDEIVEELVRYCDKFPGISFEKKCSLTTEIIENLIEFGETLPKWLERLFIGILLSPSLEEIKKIIDEVDLTLKGYPNHLKVLFYLFESIKNTQIPHYSQIETILMDGHPKIINILIQIIGNNTKQLKKQIPTLIYLFESKFAALYEIAVKYLEKTNKTEYEKILSILIDSPEIHVQKFVISEFETKYKKKIPLKFVKQMIEHYSPEIKAYLANVIQSAVKSLDKTQSHLFIYYLKSLTFIPNLKPESKSLLFNAIPEFIDKHKSHYKAVEEILLEIGSSNVIKDSERALVTLAKIKQGRYA